MEISTFSNVLTAIVTPFTKQNALDLDTFHNLIILQKKSGISGIVVLGSTGEGATLTLEESDALVSAALEHKTDDFQILVGTGTNATASTIQKSIRYSQFKAHGKKPDGLLIVTPYYNKPPQKHLIYHYNEVCSHIPETPICIYNVPSRTGVNLEVKTLIEIAKNNKNIAAIKEAAGNLNTITEMKIALDKENLSYVRILSGDDATFPLSLLCGAQGVISVTTNIIPKIMNFILESALKYDWRSVQEAYLKIYSFNSGIFCITNPIGIKFLLSKINLCQNILRPPLYPASEPEITILAKIYTELKENKIEILGE